MKMVKSHLMLKALIFDFDGLILDTETPEYLALNEMYNRYGHSLAVEAYGMVVGSYYSEKFEPVADLQSRIGQPLDATVFWDQVNTRRLALIDESPILPGVKDYLREAYSLGLKLAVASSSSHAWVEGHLKRHHLLEYFDVILAKEDVQNIKPAPDLFLAALKALRVQPEEAIIFEDSLNGVLAAGRAGVRVVLVPNPVTSHLNITGESLRISSLADLPLHALLNRL